LQENGTSKQARVTMLIFDKADFKPKLVRMDKESHYVLIMDIIYQEDIASVNIYAQNVGAPNFIKQTQLEIKGQMVSDKIIVSGFNT
jgi:hypothetical protein